MQQDPIFVGQRALAARLVLQDRHLFGAGRLGQQADEALVGFDQARVAGDCLRESAFCFVQPAHHLQHLAAVEQCLGVRRAEPQALSKMGFALLRPSQIAQRIGQIVMGIGMVRPDLDCSPVGKDSLFEPFQRP